MQLKIGKKYRIFIPADHHKKRPDRLFVGKVIYKTDKFTVFEGRKLSRELSKLGPRETFSKGGFIMTWGGNHSLEVTKKEYIKQIQEMTGKEKYNFKEFG